MEETNNNEQQMIEDVVKELKSSSEEDLKKIIEKWFESTRTEGLKIGAKYISTAVLVTINKHIGKPNASLRDYKRMTDELIKIVSVQLKAEQNDSEKTVEDDNVNKETINEQESSI